MKRFRLSKLAEADLDELWLYVAGDRGVDVADHLLDDIMGRIVLLASQPTPVGRAPNSPSAFAAFP